MCPAMREPWRHLVNTIELVLPSAHPSPQPKRQIDWSNHFCTAHVLDEGADTPWEGITLRVKYRDFTA